VSKTYILLARNNTVITSGHNYVIRRMTEFGPIATHHFS